MSESTMQAATELASQYSVQVNDDLERNVKEQERVSAEITALQQQLAALQHDHALLVNVQQALGIAAPSAQAPQAAAPQTAAPEPAATDAAVPAPRDSAAAEPATGRRTRSGKSATAAKRTTAPKPGAGATAEAGAGSAAKAAPKSAAKPAGKSAGKTAAKKASTPAASGAAASGSSAKPAAGRPTLVELVRDHLAGQKEPRSAAEVTTALSEAHSGRTIKTTVVRTTLEGLVAKNLAQRTKQGTSVYYTATEAPQTQQKQDTGTETPGTPGDN
ncbi:hypothetical protein ACVV2G_15865 [Streptomyces ziwulingensis]